MRFISSTLLSLWFAAAAWAQAPAAPKPIFDGKTLEGWEGNMKWWRVEDGCITGGSKTENVPSNEFLATTKEYGNFILRLKFKLTGFGGFINSGIQFRSKRVPKSTEMSGYQADLGDPSWWGCIYDESRRNKLMAQSDMKKIEPVLKRDDWNDYTIIADGPRIKTIINGVEAVDFTEKDPNIVQTGFIGIQIHAGGKPWMQVKDITIEELPAAAQPAAPQGQFEPAPEPGKAPKPSPLTAAEQQATFTLPPGFEIELVAEEAPGYGKFITTAWDASGRLWTMTAMEYPVDANENREAAKALYASAAKDKVLVYDLVERGGPGKPATYAKVPRVFADGLAIPLGMMPYKDGVIVQHGTQIEFRRDTDGDGKADKTEVLLEGVGIEDSHLFLHGFTRGPGGWIYTAQGAFNRSMIKAKDGSVTKFDFCKLGRFTPDGGKFEVVAAGLNNIWGFVIDRQGLMFGQEANDMGYPVTEMQVGDNFPGIGNDKQKPYAPFRPAPVKGWGVGGTGLSGLALPEDLKCWPMPYGPGDTVGHRMFYLANPITNRIQASEAATNNDGFTFAEVKDFVRSSDPWFRPIHIDFGPDGCLYITDWYNKVISHNEVPRNFPERDKTRGRIWRVRHKSQPAVTIPDLAKATPEQLTAQLASDMKWNAKTAADLLETAGKKVPASDRFKWETNDQRAAYRAASVAELLKQVKPTEQGYANEFQRYLIRAALESKGEELTKFLASPEAASIPEEVRIFAGVAMQESAAALNLAAVLPTLKRPLNEQELLPLLNHTEMAPVAASLTKVLGQRENVDLLLRLKTKFDANKLKPILEASATQLLATDPALAVKLAGAFQLTKLEPMVAEKLGQAPEAETAMLLETLFNLGSKRVEQFEPFLKSTDPAIQTQALRCLTVVPEKALAHWATLNVTQRKIAVDQITGNKPGAEAFLAAVKAGKIAKDDVDGPLVEKLQAVLGENDPGLQSLLESMGDLFRPVLTLNGGDQDFADSDITLDGPFTVETWIRLDPGMTNADAILSSTSGVTFNFYEEKLRLFAGLPAADVIVAKKKMTAQVWQHVAVTRDEAGHFKIYMSGELDNDQGKEDKGKYEHLKVGYSSAPGGTGASLTEFRVWNVCRTPQEIRANFDRTFGNNKPAGLTHAYTGSQWPKLSGKARIAKTTDFPVLVTPEQARELDVKFAKFQTLAEKTGDAAKGKMLAAVCMGCHQINGTGGMIGPNLSGIGAMGTDAILRNILTPNAAMEAGYRVYQVVLNDGSVKEGFLAQQDDSAIILRTPGTEDQRIAKTAIRKAAYLKRSLMPEGLIDGFTPEMATDLLTYLKSVK